jgi:hypothetical protein
MEERNRRNETAINLLGQTLRLDNHRHTPEFSRYSLIKLCLRQ